MRAVIKMGRSSACNTGEFDRLLPGDYRPIDEGFVALCANGAYSSNTDFRGTCSNSGGVRAWLATYGRCADDAVFRVGRDASCAGHGGYRSLLPKGYELKAPVIPTPVATTAPPPTAPPTTVPPPTAPPATDPPAVEPLAGGGCHPSYTPCVPFASDVDCRGGQGNGPAYTGRVQVSGYDEYGLDRDGDGIGCEDS